MIYKSLALILLNLLFLCNFSIVSAQVFVPSVRACDTSYSPPAVYLPIDPIALLAGGNSSCLAGSNNSPCAPHKVYSPNPVREREPLFVFLPGTNMEPDKHDQVLLTAASTGYRTIGLSYDNTVSVASACVGQTACGLNCQGDVREEVIRGINSSTNVTVARGDSVLIRLYRLLEDLDATYPLGGWSSYYIPALGNINWSNIVWENIIFGGFSQGGGHAALISRMTQVHGLFILDAVGNETCEGSLGNTWPAEWIMSGVDASAGRPKYGFRHDHGTGDTMTPAPWEALGLGTSLASIDCSGPNCDVIDTNPPSHASVTAHGHPSLLSPPFPFPLPPRCNDHNSMALDECMPTDFVGATRATLAEDYRLFEPYAQRLCYACDAVTCP